MKQSLCFADYPHTPLFRPFTPPLEFSTLGSRACGIHAVENRFWSIPYRKPAKFTKPEAWPTAWRRKGHKSNAAAERRG